MVSNHQRIINVIRQAIDQETASEAGTQLTPGTVVAGAYDTGGVFHVSAYVHSDDLLEDIIMPAGAHLLEGDIIIVATNKEGKSWVDRVVPNTIYSRLVLDYNRALLALGDGENKPEDYGEFGQVLKSGGYDNPMFWDDSATGSGGYSYTSEYLGSASGYTRTFTVSNPFVEGTMWIDVAGIRVKPEEEDGPDGTALLDREPTEGMGIWAHYVEA